MEAAQSQPNMVSMTSDDKSMFDLVLDSIERGKEGLNIGLPHGYNDLLDYWPNVQQGTYYLVGASTGAGKTSFVDHTFLYTPYDYISLKDSPFDLELTYYSFEISKINKITKGIARVLYNDFGLTVDVNYILSRGKNRISDEIFNKVLTTRKYFERLEDKITLFDMPENPTGIMKYIFSWAERNGKIIYKTIDTKDEYNNPIKRKIFDRYIPNNPNLYHIIIIDHIALTKEEKGHTSTKAIIDKTSEYMVWLRNNFNVTPVIIQQLNYDINDPIRVKINRLSPMLSDFGDSKYTTRDSNYVFSLYSPLTHSQESYAGYNTKLLGDYFRAFEILKGRDGGIGTRKGLNYINKIGVFKELPKSNLMSMNDYEKILKQCQSQ